MGKNMLCWVLALVLCVSLLPVEAGAVGEDSDVVATVTTGGKTTPYSIDGTNTTAEAALRAAWSYAQGKTATVTLWQNVTLADETYLPDITSASNITLDLKEHTLSGSYGRLASHGLITVSSNGNLTIQNGTLRNNYTGNNQSYSLYASKGTVTILNSTITGSAYYGVSCTNSSCVTVNKSKIDTSYAKGAGINVSQSTVSIAESEIKASGSDGRGIYVKQSNNQVTLSNSTITGTSVGVQIQDQSCKMELEDGVTIVSENEGIFIDGGVVDLAGATVNVTGKKTDSGVYGVVISSGTLNMSEGTTINIKGGSSNSSKGIYLTSASSKVQISGGTITMERGEAGVYVNNATLEMSGGEMSGGGYGLFVNGTTSNVTLSGGTFGGQCAVYCSPGTLTVAGLLKSGYAYYKVEQETETLITEKEKLENYKLTDRTIRVKPEVLVTSDPQDATVTVGETTTFTVEATGIGELSYQWQVKTGEDGASWANIAGATDKTYITGETTLTMTNNQYRCVVTNTNSIIATSEAATLTVEPVSYTVTVKASEGGTASANYETATAGATVTLTATPSEGYHFSKWEVVSGGVTITDNTFTMPAGEVTVKAVFEADPEPVPEYTITLIADPVGGGTVSGGGHYSPGTEVTVTATPASGYRFVGWLEEGVTLSTEASYTFSPAEDRTLTAKFAAVDRPSHPTYPISLEDPDPGHGEVDYSTDRARAGNPVTVTVTPEEGYALDELIITDKNGDPVPYTDQGEGKYTFTMPVGGVKVEVHFLLDGGWATCPRDETCPIWPYPDASPTGWYHDGVHFCIDQGLMVGFEDGTFRPDGATSRAMIAVILWRQAGCPAVSTPTPFTDVAEDAWYAPALRWAAAQGVVTGTSPTTFAPEDPITREQLAAMLWRCGGCPESGEDLTAFPDAGESSEYARPALAWAKETGLLLGQDTGLLEPAGYATRAETAQVIWRWVTGVL